VASEHDGLVASSRGRIVATEKRLRHASTSTGRADARIDDQEAHVISTRIGSVLAATAIATALVTGPVAAADSTQVTVTHGIVLDTQAAASRTCGFPIELHTVGMEVRIDHFAADGTLRSSTLVQVYDGDLLNPANGKSIRSHVAGPTRDVYAADGTITETASGATVRTAPGAGLVSGFIGREKVVLVPTGGVDEDGNPEYDIPIDIVNGQFLGNGGVCSILA
jgi:hypothetical protein